MINTINRILEEYAFNYLKKYRTDDTFLSQTINVAVLSPIKWASTIKPLPHRT